MSALYAQMHDLPPTLQMFLAGCPAPAGVRHPRLRHRTAFRGRLMTPQRIWLVGTGTVGAWLAGPLGSISHPCPPLRGQPAADEQGSGPLAEHDRGDFPAPRLDNGVSWP